jgi:hypothetical protein
LYDWSSCRSVQLVIAGLDPAIHHFKKRFILSMDARVKPAHDEMRL